jgi:hypothetical protein
MREMTAAIVLVAVTLGGGAAAQDSGTGPGDSWVVDFRYAPADWQTCIGLPDDWQKTLVGKNGALLYDYPGRYGGFRTRITAFRDAEWVGQGLHSGRVPVVVTHKRSGTIEITEEAFSVAPPIAPVARPKNASITLERVGSSDALIDWANPEGDVDPAFAGAAVGWGEPIRYRVRDAGPGEYTVVFGLCEGHRGDLPRILDLQIEGETRATVDMIADHGVNVPALFTFSARDLDGDNAIDIAVAPAKDSKDTNTILNVLWVFKGGTVPPEPELLAGKGTGEYTHIACGIESWAPGPSRNDILIIRLRNTGAEPRRTTPLVSIESEAPITRDDVGRRLSIGSATVLTSSHTYNWTRPADRPGFMLLSFAIRELAPGESYTVALGVGRGRGAADVPESVAQAEELREKAVRFWESEANLPYGRIEVPDPQIQALLDSSIRNIYQAREIKKGEPAFQVGPTCYRGLWVVDGAFILEAVSFLGRTDEVRRGLSQYLDRQRPDGAIEFINGHRKETGIALWMLARHARLTGDRKWLESVWPHVERAFGYIQDMRRQTMANPDAPNAGLIPAGFSDGGLGGMAEEYTNVYWSLVGVRAAADAARWLGKIDTADAWDREYDDFYATFRRAAERDMRDDGKGNRYLPIRMTDNAGILPQKAQWGFCHAVFPGRLFAKDDPLVLGSLAMLEAVEKEGLVLGTGWQTGGIWNYFASFYAHAWLWQGDGEKAARILYAFANHAAPLLCWREEQGLVGDPAAGGDMPHNWAGAEFIRLVRDLLVLERGDELHLFEGLPAAWITPGAKVRLNGVVTEFGPISLELTVADDGRTAHLRLAPPMRTPPARILLHLDDWSGREGTIELPASGRIDREIDLIPSSEP